MRSSEGRHYRDFFRRTGNAVASFFFYDFGDFWEPGGAFGGLQGGPGPITSFFDEFRRLWGGILESMGVPWTPWGPHCRHFGTTGDAFRCIFVALGPEPRFSTFGSGNGAKIEISGVANVAET